MVRNVLQTRIAFLALNVILAFGFFAASKTVLAQELSPAIRQAIPAVEEKLRSPNVAERIDVLKELVYKQKDRDVRLVKLRYENLPASDYVAVLKSVFEFDLSALNEKTADEAWWRIQFIVVNFELKQFGKTLAAHLLKAESSVQYQILQTLRAIKAVETISEIAALPFWAAHYARELALETLIAFRAKEAVPKLVSLLYDKDKYKKSYAIENLVKLKAIETAGYIGELLDDEDANVRYRALKAVAKFGARQFAPKLWKFIGTGETGQTEDYALAALAAFGEERAIRLVLIRTVTKDSTNSHSELFQNLVEIKATAIIPAYIAVLENDNQYLVEHGMDDHVRMTAMNVLDKLHAREVIPVLRKYARGEKRNKSLQRDAVKILGNLRAREAVDDLLPLLDKNATENAAYDAAEAALALAKIGERRTRKQLIDFAANPNCPYGSLIIIELNRHLDAELWRKAEEKTVSRQDIVSIKEAAEVYSQEADVQIVLHFEPGKDVSKRKPLATPYKDTKGYPWVNTGEMSLIDALREIPRAISEGILPQNFTFIFDDKQIHILPVDRAIDWWRKNILTKPEYLNARTS